MGFPGGAGGKEPTCQFRSLKRREFNPWIGKIPLEDNVATHSSILVWRIPWTDSSGGLHIVYGVAKASDTTEMT